MAKKLKQFFTNLVTKWLEDIFILIGLGVIVGMTYQLNQTAAIYLIGALFVVFGLFIAKK